MTLKTLADVRTLIEKHLPAESRAKPPWRHVALLLTGAARSEEDAREVSVALQLVFQLEGVKCRPQ